MTLPPLLICGVTTAAADKPEDAALVVLLPEGAAYGMSKTEAEGAIRSAFTDTEAEQAIAWLRSCWRPVVVLTTGGGLSVGELRGAWCIGAKGGDA